MSKFVTNKVLKKVKLKQSETEDGDESDFDEFDKNAASKSGEMAASGSIFPSETNKLVMTTTMSVDHFPLLLRKNITNSTLNNATMAFNKRMQLFIINFLILVLYFVKFI